MVYTPNAATTDFAKGPSWTGPSIHVGVIGGSGLYKLEGMEVVAEINPITVSVDARVLQGCPMLTLRYSPGDLLHRPSQLQRLQREFTLPF
jgi:hypothetical protein